MYEFPLTGAQKSFLRGLGQQLDATLKLGKGGLTPTFFAELQKSSDVRIIADGKGFTPYQRFYLAASAYAGKRPDVLKAFYNDIAQTGRWVKQNPKAAAELIAPIVGTDAATVERAINRRSLDVRQVQVDDLEEQQKIADTFLSLGVLPVPVVAKNATLWLPK